MRMEKGLCFKCDKKWAHATGANNEEEESEEEVNQVDEDVDFLENSIQTEISLNSVMGLNKSKIMKLKGEINGESVVVMIDSGPTHNLSPPRW